MLSLQISFLVVYCNSQQGLSLSIHSTISGRQSGTKWVFSAGELISLVVSGQVYMDIKNYALFFFRLKPCLQLAHACTEGKFRMFAQYKLVNKYFVLMRFSTDLWEYRDFINHLGWLSDTCLYNKIPRKWNYGWWDFTNKKIVVLFQLCNLLLLFQSLGLLTCNDFCKKTSVIIKITEQD